MGRAEDKRRRRKRRKRKTRRKRRRKRRRMMMMMRRRRRILCDTNWAVTAGAAILTTFCGIGENKKSLTEQ